MDESITAAAYDLKTLAGGVDTISQIQICGTPSTG
jgi:hypothetical protein